MPSQPHSEKKEGIPIQYQKYALQLSIDQELSFFSTKKGRHRAAVSIVASYELLNASPYTAVVYKWTEIQENQRVGDHMMEVQIQMIEGLTGAKLSSPQPHMTAP